MTIGPDSDPIKLDFSLEAKLYSEGNNVGVREISRLISRIRHREFGVLVTTSSVSKQAYSEIREDGHPIVVVSGSDICEILVTNGIVSKSQCQSWLNSLEP
jgi:restriction endonuclease Mrr